MSASAMAGERPASPVPRVVPVLCFALLGGLTAGRANGGMAIASALVSLAIGWLALVLLGWLMAAYSREMGRREARAAVTRGFLLLVPSTVLALVATWGLGWDAAAAIASAGIMTASVAVGAEVAGAGGRRLAAIVLPLLLGIALSALWIASTSVAAPTLWAAVQRILPAALGGGAP
jgi:hypothetical protein